jgi:hypothetical protein
MKYGSGVRYRGALAELTRPRRSENIPRSMAIIRLKDGTRWLVSRRELRLVANDINTARLWEARRPCSAAWGLDL